MKAEGVEIDPEVIELEKPIKELGIYNLNAKIHDEVESVIKVWVVKADEEDGDPESDISGDA